jgi:hypothetical protein
VDDELNGDGYETRHEWMNDKLSYFELSYEISNILIHN